MANGHVEIHDPFDNNNMASSNTDPTSQTASMDDTVEFKLLMVYAQRRRPSRAAELDSPRQTDPLLTQTAENDKEAKEEDGKKKKKMMRKKKSGGGKGMWRMFSCIKPSTKCDEPSEPTLGAPKPALGAPEPALGAPEPEFRCGVLRTGETLKGFFLVFSLPLTLKPHFRHVSTGSDFFSPFRTCFLENSAHRIVFFQQIPTTLREETSWTKWRAYWQRSPVRSRSPPQRSRRTPQVSVCHTDRHGNLDEVRKSSCYVSESAFLVFPVWKLQNCFNGRGLDGLEADFGGNWAWISLNETTNALLGSQETKPEV